MQVPPWARSDLGRAWGGPGFLPGCAFAARTARVPCGGRDPRDEVPVPKSAARRSRQRRSGPHSSVGATSPHPGNLPSQPAESAVSPARLGWCGRPRCAQPERDGNAVKHGL